MVQLENVQSMSKKDKSSSDKFGLILTVGASNSASGEH